MLARAHFLLDLYSAIKPQIRLNVVDAIIGMEGEGPTIGDPVNLGLILAGKDALAVDLVASAVIGWDPMDVGTNYLVAKRGLGPSSLNQVEIVGIPLEEAIHPFEKPEIHQDCQPFIDIRMPILCNEGVCVGCGICSQICPGGAIQVEAKPEFYDEKCIQCFCCVELCPQGALRAVRPI